MTSDATRAAEVDAKVEKTARFARDNGFSAILLAAQHNVSWITAGRTIRIDATRETGSGILLITADNRRFALSNTIENPRMRDETVAGLGFEVLEYPWTAERADAMLPFQVAARVVPGPLAADIATPAAKTIEPQLSRLRSTLTVEEIPRYRQFANEVGEVFGRMMRTLKPGMTELDVASVVTTWMVELGAFPNVLLVATDDRITKYRHPVPTLKPWRQKLLVACCPEREGHVVAITRLASVGAPDEDFRQRTRATGQVFGALLAATKSGATGAQLFDAAAKGYAKAGYPNEELLHHQGGVIACRSREWVAHPASDMVAAPPQAFAWNPTITGSKVEETVLLHEDDRLEVVTTSPDWPSFEVSVRGQQIAVPDVLGI